MDSPPAPSSTEVTQLLIQWKAGNKEALDLLLPVVYRELRNLANHFLHNESAAATMQPTALVHDAYLRLVAQKLPDFESRAHFFGIAAHLMRQILVDSARKRNSAKRGSGAEKLSLDEVVSFSPARDRDIEDLDQALNELAGIDERKSKVIELRFFGGLSLEETAQALGTTVAIIRREQRLAEAWLHRQVGRAGSAEA